MSEISNIRPWTHIHNESKEIGYFIDVYRKGIIETDQWDFGTNKKMWEETIEIIKKNLPK